MSVNNKKTSPQPKVRRGPYMGTIIDAPDYRKIPFIHTGYRLGYNVFQALISLFALHNETVNVWSHLIPNFFWFYLILRAFEENWSYGWVHVFMPSLYLAGCIYGLAASCTFHWLNCVNKRYHHCLRTWDFSGIGLIILASEWPINYYALYCQDWSLKIILVFTGILSPLLCCVPFMHYFHQNQTGRILIYVTSASMPAYCWLHITFTEGWDSPLQAMLFKPILWSYLCYGIGVIIYIIRVPERFLPGTFDIWGSSHQIWHFFVIAGQWLLYQGINDTLHWRLSGNTCLL